MLWGIKRFLQQFLQTNNLYWNKGVDLGAGRGDAQPILRNYVLYLIGIDVNEQYLNQAKGYDELILSNIREYAPPLDTDVVFLFDVIEHLPQEDGEILLDKLATIKNILITTPAKYYFHAGNSMTHLSHWAEEDFLTRGYYTTVFMAGGFLNLFAQPIIFAFKLEEKV